jgi:hypothetical protein
MFLSEEKKIKSSEHCLLSNFGFFKEDFIDYYYKILPILGLFKDISLLSSVYASLLALGGFFFNPFKLRFFFFFFFYFIILGFYKLS